MSDDELKNYKHQTSEQEDKKLNLQALSLYGGTSYLYPYLRPGIQILDVGCGTGVMAMEMCRRATSAKVIGIDANERSISLNKANPDFKSATNLLFKVGKARDLDFDNNTFDLTHCRFVLMHIKEASDALAEMVRVTKPGGLVIAHESVQDAIFLRPRMPCFEKILTEWNQDAYASGLDPSIGLSLFGMFNIIGLEQIETKNVVTHVTTDEACFKDYIEMYKLELEGLRESLGHRIEPGVFAAAKSELESLPEPSSLLELTVVAVGRKPH